MTAKISALTTLPHDWQKWIVDNLDRACDPQAMAEVMVRDGRFSPILARAAIEDANRAKAQSDLAVLEMPDIDTSASSIRASDRTIDVLMALLAPRIVLLGNVLSGEECDALTALSEPRLVRSPVVNDSDGSLQMHQARTSRGAMIERAETALVGRVEARLAEIAAWPIERGEGLQIQQYQATNEYRPHFDWFDASLPGPRKHMELGGQRLATFVLYLSEVESGGGTAFPSIGLEVMPKKGGAVFFQNTNHRHVPDQLTLHAGCPVTRGVKTIANKWLRERPY